MKLFIEIASAKVQITTMQNLKTLSDLSLRLKKGDCSERNVSRKKCENFVCIFREITRFLAKMNKAKNAKIKRNFTNFLFSLNGRDYLNPLSDVERKLY